MGCTVLSGHIHTCFWSTFVLCEKFNNGLCTHFLQLHGLKSSRNSSRLINCKCKWILTSQQLFLQNLLKNAIESKVLLHLHFDGQQPSEFCRKWLFLTTKPHNYRSKNRPRKKVQYCSAISCTAVSVSERQSIHWVQLTPSSVITSSPATMRKFPS